MKAIMISIKPKWVAKILNGEKTIEIRKTMPKCDLPIDVYIYCTKGNPIGKFGDGLYHEITIGSKWANGCSWNMPKIYLEGKVVAKFTLNSVVKCKLINDSKFDDFFHSDYQLTRKELKDYVGDNVYYEWHIDNLIIFDKPKELSEFYKSNEQMEYIKSLWEDYGLPDKDDYDDVILTKAPKSWCYVEELL